MYWSVIGAFVAFEYVAEWLISWYVHLISRPINIVDNDRRSPQVPVLLGDQNNSAPISGITPDPGTHLDVLTSRNDIDMCPALGLYMGFPDISPALLHPKRSRNRCQHYCCTG